MLDLNFYIYRHIRPDTNEVFYIGKGNTLGKSHSNRAYEKSGRNTFWNRIVSKNNGEFKVEIIYKTETEQEINEKEKEFIALYGRRNLGMGTLVNLTDGGDGSVGVVCKEETRKKLSEKFSGANHPNFGKKLSVETCRKKSESMKASDKNLKGKKLPDWWKEKIRQAKFGANNPMYNKTGALHRNSKAVINVLTGEIYESIEDTETKNGVTGKRIYWALSNGNANKTPFIYLETYNKIGKEESLRLVCQRSNRWKCQSKKVIDTETGEEYVNAIEAAKTTKYCVEHLRRMLSGKTQNKTTLKYANGL